MNKYVLIGFGVLSLVCVLLMWRVDVLSKDNKKLTSDLEIANAAIKEHQNNIKITESINNEHQDRINNLNATVKRLQQRPAKCITVTSPASIHSEQGSGPGHDRKDGISSRWLFDYAAEAEQYRIERNSCKDFVNRTWESLNK